MVIINRKKWQIFLLISVHSLLLCFAGCDNLSFSEEIDVTETNLIETTVNNQYCTTDFFAGTKHFKIYFEEWVYIEESSSLQLERTELSLGDEEERAFIELLIPYNNTLSNDVLKSDFMTYYNVELDNKIELIIDADCNNHGGDKSYMFVRHHNNGLLKICGTYIDASVVEFLAKKLN